MGREQAHDRVMPVRLSQNALTVIRRQRHVVALWQADELGIQHRAMHREVAAERWTPLTRRTFLALPIAPRWDHLRVAGCLELGRSAVLTGTAALQEAGWSGDSGEVDVLLPPGSHPKRSIEPWIRPHFGDAGRVEGGGVPRVRSARAAVDAASVARSDREAAYLLITAVQQRLTTGRALLAEARRRPRLRRAGLIHEVALAADSGVHSLPEYEFARQCRRRGLPEPHRQTLRRDEQGRARFTDVEFDLPGGGRLIVEVDGGGHLDPAVAGDDAVRGSMLARTTGAHVLRVTSLTLRGDPDPFFAELTAWLLP